MRNPLCTRLLRALFLLSAFLLASCSLLPAPSTTSQTPPLPSLPAVSVKQLSFAVEGSPFRFIGANAIYFGFYRQYGLSIEEALQSAKENGLSVIRIYLGFGDSPWGGRAYEEYDRVLDIAAKHGVYIIATLTDCCCFGTSWGNTPENYFAKVPYCNLADAAALDSFKGYIKSILLRKNTVNGKIYRDDTTILAWDIANEPALQCFSSSELHDWLQQVVTFVKSIDPNHLITIGIDAHSNLYSTDGPHYEALNVPGLDFFSFHYNLPNYRVVKQHLDRLAYRVSRFLAMGKPVVLEEFGVGSQRILGTNVDKNTLDGWLQSYHDQLDIVFSLGASGAMFWGWGVSGTETVPLWWNQEDHDVTETEFCTLLREYVMPPSPAQ